MKLAKNFGHIVYFQITCFLFSSLIFILITCGDNSQSKDASTDYSDVPSEEALLPQGCLEPHDPVNPQMRMIFFDLLKPDNLNNQVLENLMADGFYNGDFIWLLDMKGVDDGSSDNDGKFHLLTGSGLPVGKFPDSGCFKFRKDPRWPDVETNAGITGDNISWLTGEPKINIDVPIFKTNPETHVQNLLLVLPLKEVEITGGQFSSDRTMIGATNSCENTGGGVLEGMITVEDAKNVVISEMGVSLCGLLSGDKGSNIESADDDCQKPISQWPVQPDSQLNGQPAYKMSACFSAEKIKIIE